MMNTGVEFPETSRMADQRQAGNHPFHVMAKPIGPLCNLNCTYCFYLEKESLYPGESRWQMSADTLEAFIRQEIENQHTPDVVFAWQGGEPTLLGVSYFAKILELQKKYAGTRNIHNALQTNGVLLDEEWCSFLSKHEFLVGVSIDGPRELHDVFRKQGRRGSFTEVLRGIELLKKHQVEFNTLTVVQRHNSMYPLDVYRFLKEIGSRYLQFIPIVERTAKGVELTQRLLAHPGCDPLAEVTEWSVDPAEYGTFLCSIFDEWVRRDVGTVFVQIFDVALECWMGMQPSLCVFRERCGDAPVLEHNGDLYSCDHFVYPEYRLGNIGDQSVESLARSEQQIRFGREKRDALPHSCLTCPVRFACNGECPRHRFLTTPDGEDGLNYLCAAYKKFFHYIDAPMRFMAEELKNRRPPANIMKFMTRWDSDAARRNEPCFCGSGNKYKLCHGL